MTAFQTCNVWLKEPNTALAEQPRRRRPAFLKEENIPRFRARIEAGAQPADGVCSLRGTDIQRILQEEFSTSYRLNSAYDLLHRLGYSSSMPRPRHAQADKERQDEFKKVCNEIAAIKSVKRGDDQSPAAMFPTV